MEAFINWGVAKYFRRAMSFSPAADIGVKHVSVWYRSSSSSQYSSPESVKLWENVELLAERGWSGVGGMVGGPLLQTSTAKLGTKQLLPELCSHQTLHCTLLCCLHCVQLHYSAIVQQYRSTTIYKWQLQYIYAVQYKYCIICISTTIHSTVGKQPNKIIYLYLIKWLTYN